MTEQPMMDPIRVEDRALKKILRPTDFSREVAIPRAHVKRFPSNVSSLVRSASARHPTKGLDRQQNYLDKRLIMSPATNNGNHQFKTIPIDIATLQDSPTPKLPVSRGIGRSYSNRVTPQQQQVRSPAFRRTTPARPPSSANGGGSFLYSGNYDPNHPNQPIITKPAGKQASNKASASPQQNWVLAGGPSTSAGGAAAAEKKPGKKEMLQEMALDVAKDQAKEGLANLAMEGGLDPGALGGDFIAGMGGKLGSKAGGKLGGKIGKKLGNEEMGNELGEAIGDELGDMAADMAKDAALDAIGDLAAGEGIDIAPPEIPDAGQLCAKCVIV
ncbi:hypothetical protein Fcan01_14264 [Folsomia candida]|uniref:Uncharacterized protein n=1 Tax=Folsomia candida TaxID=158441 RepID=A0A226E2B5_FOLCA|nr:hypothetical protein Fcan01_14264 [Folsomia candida]